MAGARLRGRANPNGAATTVYFKYRKVGTSTWTQTPDVDAGSGTVDFFWTHSLTGLDPSTPYEYEAFGTNSGGTGTGGLQNFSTLGVSSSMWLHVDTPGGYTHPTLVQANGAAFYAHGVCIGASTVWTDDLSSPTGWNDLTRAIDAGFNFIRGVVYWGNIQPNPPTMVGGVPTGGWAGNASLSTGAFANMRANAKRAKDAGIRVMIDMHNSGPIVQANTPGWLWNGIPKVKNAQGQIANDDIAKNALFDNDFFGLGGEWIGGTGVSNAAGTASILGNIPATAEWVLPTCSAAAGGAQLSAAWGPLTLWLNAVRKIMRVMHDASHPDGFGVLDNVCVVDFMNEPGPGKIGKYNDPTPAAGDEPDSAEDQRVFNYRAFNETGAAWIRYDNPEVVACYETHIFQRNKWYAPNGSRRPIYGNYNASTPTSTDWNQLPSQTTWPAGKGGLMIQVRGYFNGDPAGAIHTMARNEITKTAVATKFDALMAHNMGHAILIGEWTMLDTVRAQRSKQSQTVDDRGKTLYGKLVQTDPPIAPKVLGGRGESWSLSNTTGDFWDGSSNATKAEGGILDVIKAWPMHHCIWPFGNNVHHEEAIDITATAISASGNSSATIVGCQRKLKKKTAGALDINTNNHNEPVVNIYLAFLKP